MATFTDRAAPLAAAAAQIARLKGATAEATVLEKARASLVQTGYDNWDGGIDLYTFMLEVPIVTYASIDDERENLEKSILKRLHPLTRGGSGNSITEVVISPLLADDARPAPDQSSGHSEVEPPGFWEPGFFRLFISHLAAHRSSAHRLKEALAAFQIAAFVAHDDIEPTKEWQLEIEKALRTMDAMAAIIAPGFVESRWCDQEVGIAIGRGKLVVPLCAGADPHGFLGKHQGIQTKSLDPAGIAEKVYGAIAGHALSSERMSEMLIERLAAARSWDSAKRTTSLLEKVSVLNPTQISRLIQVAEDNPEVKGAFKVPERIRSIVARIGGAV